LGNIQFSLSWETLLYGVAALFCLFACRYSIGYLPFDKSVIQWHFWLSLGRVVRCVIGQVVFYFALREGARPQLGVAGRAVALSFLATIPILLATQLLFAFVLVRALLRVRLG
jgi:hypothetical protein